MNSFSQNLDNTLNLSEQITQPIKCVKKDGANIEYNKETLMDAYIDALVLTELNSLLQSSMSNQYKQQDDPNVHKLQEYAKKLQIFNKVKY